MRTLLSWLFYILGVVFFVLILGGAYLYVADPFGLREIVPLLMQQPASASTPKESATAEDVVPASADKNAALSASQEAALETVGINPAALPTSVTDTQKTCLINAVGEARANEIKAGAMPTPMEILKAKSCF